VVFKNKLYLSYWMINQEVKLIRHP